MVLTKKDSTKTRRDTRQGMERARCKCLRISDRNMTISWVLHVENWLLHSGLARYALWGGHFQRLCKLF
jgi:hypothetical protein